MEIIIIVTFIIILLNTIKYQITHLVKSIQELGSRATSADPHTARISENFKIKPWLKYIIT